MDTQEHSQKINELESTNISTIITYTNSCSNKSPKTTTQKASKISPWQQFFNAIVANFWVGPLVVMYWASTWNLVSREIIFPNEIYTSIWVSAGIGFGIQFIACCSQNLLAQACRPRQTGIGSVVLPILVSRCYTYIVAFGSVNQWISIWRAWDMYTSMTTYNALGTTLAAYSVMFILRCSTQVLAAPSLVPMDVPLRSYFETSTYFGTKIGTWQHVLDSFFSVFFVHTVVVTAWRGVWYLSDKWFVPDDFVHSALCSLAIAYGLEALLLLTRGLWKKASIWSDGHHLLVKCIVEDIHSFLHGIVAISHWRGFWILYEQDFMDVPLKFWLGHAIAFTLLTLSLCSNSFLPRGCLCDGVEVKGKGIDFDMRYVTNMTRMWRKTRAKTGDVTCTENETKSWHSLQPV